MAQASAEGCGAALCEEQLYPTIVILVREHVGGAGVVCRVIRLIAVHSLGGAVLGVSANHQHSAVGAQRDRAAEFVAGIGVRALDVCAVRPGVAGSRKEVDRAGFLGLVPVLAP